MFSRSPGRLSLPKIALFAIGLTLPAACAAGPATSTASLGARTPASAAPGSGLGTFGAPATASLPSSSDSGRAGAKAHASSSTAAASAAPGTGAKPGSAGISAAGSGPAASGSAVVYGFSAAEVLYDTSAEQVQQLEAMKATGVTSVRVDADWSIGQPDNATSYSWATLDQLMASVQKVGLSADLIIDGCPPWAGVASAAGNQFAQPASSAAFASWAAAVAKRYAGKGAKYFEIWNEPNNPSFWEPSPNPAAYTADLEAAYAAIKAVDPSAVIISGGLAPEPDSATSIAPLTFLQDMYADGAQGSFDGVGFHPYSYPTDPDTAGAVNAWTEMSETSPSVRSIMAAHGDASKKVWITEFGAPTSGTTANVSESGQTTELVQAISQVKDLGWIGSFYLYTWEDVTNEGFGLLTIDGVQKSAYSAVVAALAG